MKDYSFIITSIFTGHFYGRISAVVAVSSICRFYLDRIRACPGYGLVQGREILKMLCRCAFNDSSLTDDESIAIMETCLDPDLDNILMEVNYNESW